ncbi:hypothetical protein A9Q84_10900 [Halobacteriovorax marinus]|uniref:Solute-binding protein family 3/N-terminal domain-containing protein n=1 Tax=Halobacteriovorax marinus TaxID=97084 RepID=A0A1Y5F7E3_9BACT|nr:hypothetical protein A9Q84_10900 [Halobacteriovorax marinus]
MKKVILGLCSIYFLLSSSVLARQIVVVGGYIFPPFISQEKGNTSGITIDLIRLLNQSQEKYQFVFKLTSPKRRYKDFKGKDYDMIFFENRVWGWNKYPILASKVILKGGEVFIAKSATGRGQEYFKNLKNKKILGILGYHYQFAKFKSDRKFLKKYFNMELGTNHESNLNYIISRDQTAIAIVTKSFFNQFIKKRPELKDQYLVSEKYDQIYNHTILVRKDFSPSVREMNNFIRTLSQSHKLSGLWKKYGIE